jgi:hypothetical protein
MPRRKKPGKQNPISWLKRVDFMAVGVVLLAIVYVAGIAVAIYFFARGLLHHHWTPDGVFPWTICLPLGGALWFYLPRILTRRARMQSARTVLLRFSPTDRLFDLSSRDAAESKALSLLAPPLCRRETDGAANRGSHQQSCTTTRWGRSEHRGRSLHHGPEGEYH